MVGFLVLENGIALLAVLGTFGIPLIVELGVFLDVLMGFLVMQVFIYHIHGTFEIDRCRTIKSTQALKSCGHDMIFYYLLLPAAAIAALLACLVRPYRRWVGWVNAWLSLVSLGAALAFVSSRFWPAVRRPPSASSETAARRQPLGPADGLRRRGRHAGTISQPRSWAREPI